MQRVAEELLVSLRARPDTSVFRRVLRGSSSSMYVKTGPFLARSLWQIPRIVRQHEIDVVVFSSMVSGALALPLRRVLETLGALSVAVVHGRDVTIPVRSYQSLVPRVFAALGGVIAVSRATGEACTLRGLPPAKLRIVPNGVDVERFEPITDRRTMRNDLVRRFRGRHAMPSNAFLLCSVGRHVERKGFLWFVREVIPLLPADVHYWIAGSGPQSSTIKRAVAHAGVGARVRILGRVSEHELMTLYRGADLLVQPNIDVQGDFEGFGVVMLEAGMCGLPVLAADVDGIPDVIADGRNGYIVPTGNAHAFAGKITALRQGQAARTALGVGAVRYTRDTFAWPLVAERFVAVLRELRGETARATVPPAIGAVVG